MTLRRLLKKDDAELIPAKYLRNFQSLLTPDLKDLPSLRTYLEETGKRLNVNEQEKLDEEIKLKLKKEKFDSSFRGKVNKLLDCAMNSPNFKIKAIAIGSLLYFVNPFDLIPDFSGPFGYVDDLGVMTFALSSIVKIKYKDSVRL